MLYGRSGNQESRKGGATASRLAALACCLLLAAHCQLALAAPVEYRWHADSERTAAPDIPVWQGETVRLIPAFRARGVPADLSADTFALYWQTNGMGAAWWSAPAAAGAETGTVVATWSPTNDVGARAYTFFIGSTSSSGTSYRAHGRLLMRPAPGATPSILAAPTTLTDAMAAWADSRYDPAGAAQAVSNALAEAMQHIQPSGGGDSTNWQPIVYGMTNGAARGETALQPADTNGWTVGTHAGLLTPAWASTGTVANADYALEAFSASVAIDAGTAAQLAQGVPDKQALDAATAHLFAIDAHPDIRDDIADATNTLIQTYLLGTNAWMTVSNATLTIWRETNGIPAALWSSAESEGGGVDPSFTNAVWQALSAKADTAWGKYAPDGSANPDPAYMTYLNAPATMHASGFQWATYGAYSVMAESGAVAYESGADGTARWGLDLHTNYVGFVRGGSVIVAARAGAIAVSGGGTTNGIAEIAYPYTSGDFPALWYAPTLDVPFTLQPGVVWIDNQDGTATVTAPATAAKGFWFATTTSTYDVMFDIRPPARLSGGVIGATNAVPVVYDSTITVTSGGKTYRIPAQEVP